MSKFIEVTNAQQVRSVIKIDSVIEIKPNTIESSYIKLVDGSDVSSNRPYHEVVKMVTGLDVQEWKLQ